MKKDFVCQWNIGIEKQGPAMRLGEGGGAAAALLRNHPIFSSSHPARGHFLSTIQTNLSGTLQILKALFMDEFVPGIFRVAIKLIVTYFRSK
jgi:hypothetical protein